MATSRTRRKRHDLWQGTVRLHNCRIIRNHRLVWEDLWYCTPHQLRQASLSGAAAAQNDDDGTKKKLPTAAKGQDAHPDHPYSRIIDPEARFWVAQEDKLWAADVMIDCGGLIVASGYIDLQINGAFGVDFTSGKSCFDEDEQDSPTTAAGTSSDGGDGRVNHAAALNASGEPTDETVFRGLATVGNGVLAHGVTAIVPTLVSSAPSTYAARIPQIRRFMRQREEQQMEQARHPRKATPRPVSGARAAQQERLFPASPKGDLPKFTFDLCNSVSSNSSGSRRTPPAGGDGSAEDGGEEGEEELQRKRKQSEFEDSHSMESVIMEVGFADDSVMDRPQARILGIHVEGPFISVPGAHQPEFLCAPEQGLRSLCLTYGSREWKEKLQTEPTGKQQREEGRGQGQEPSQRNGTEPHREEESRGLPPSCNSNSEDCPPHSHGCGEPDETLLEAAWDTLEDISIITMAPELHGALDAVLQLQDLIRETHARSLSHPLSTRFRKPVRTIVSAGHSRARIRHALQAQAAGIRLLTHLFNAMEAFHHRDPGLIGLLGTESGKPLDAERTPGQRQTHLESLDTSGAAQPIQPGGMDCRNSSSCSSDPSGRAAKEISNGVSLGSLEPLDRVFWSVIVDGIHVHPASLRIAAAAHPEGAVLITDAISAMGLHPGTYLLGDIVVDISQDKATVHGQRDTLAGAVVSLDECVRRFQRFTGCDIVAAIEAASLHPAQCLGLEERLGHTKPGADADLVFLDDELMVKGCIVNGQLAWCEPGVLRIIESTSDPRRFK